MTMARLWRFYQQGKISQINFDHGKPPLSFKAYNSQKLERLVHLKKSLIYLLLFFYLFSTTASATHIHHDMLKTHDDCKVCIVAKNLHSANLPSAYHFEPALDISTEISTLLSQTDTYLYNKYIYSQAPPLFSL